jgi:DNA modification methylase
LTLRFCPAQIEQWPLARLKPYARNARTHSENQIARIAASLIAYGWTAPVMVSDDGEIVAGHGRLLAAQHLDLDQVPVIRLSHLTPEQVRAYRIADNRLAELSGWDDELLAAELHALNAAGFDLDLTGFDGEDLERLLAPLDDEGDGLAGDDVIPEPPVTPVSRPGDLWLLGEHRLLCGDSTKAEDVIRVMHNHKAILFASDPPYLVDYDGTNHPSKQPEKGQGKDCAKRAHSAKNKDWGNSYGITWDDSSQGPELYEGFIRQAIAHAILPNAAWYCWHASRRQAMVEGVWEKFGAFVHQQLIWAKDRGILTRSYYLWQHEPCFFGWLKGHKPPRVSDDYPSTVWNLPTVKVGEKTEHPTSKPVEVFAIPMRQHARPGEVCFEPFSGSGSQIIAGETTGRRVFAIEISPQYVDVAVKRWQTATARQAVLDGDGRTFEAIASERLAQAA